MTHKLRQMQHCDNGHQSQPVEAAGTRIGGSVAREDEEHVSDFPFPAQTQTRPPMPNDAKKTAKRCHLLMMLLMSLLLLQLQHLPPADC